MASAVRGVWAIDIGTNALKALQMYHGEEGLEVSDFSYIEHSQNLSSAELSQAEKDLVIAESLQGFLDEKDLAKSEVAISIAGQNSFARFINLPPVEAKKIPEVVQFEAVQQIPFDINEVEWDWQLMEAEDSPDKRVGLFAIKNELIAEVMDHFTKEDLRVTCVQIAPMALYNYAFYDVKEIQTSPDKAVVILDIGAENTTLVVCTSDSVWQRSIRIGGNTFTEAIADAFKKNYAIAEKLKRTAPMSKYMRQIYTAMKSVYTDLGSEIQRSLGFYSSSAEGRDKTLSKVIALGGGMKLQGLSKYLTNTLGVPVVKPDSFESLTLAPDISTAKFHENLSDFGVAYGLGVQLLGEAKISTNMLPRKIARAMAWTRKARMFTIAASILLLVMVLSLGRAYKDLKQYESHSATRSDIQRIIAQVRDISSSVSEQQARQQPLETELKKIMEYFEYRDTVPTFIGTLAKCLPNKDNNPKDSELYSAFESGDIKKLTQIPRQDRKQLFLTQFAMKYSESIEAASFPEPGARVRTFRRRGASGGGAEGAFNPMMFMPGTEGMMPGGPMGGRSMPESEEGKEGSAGFTVLIEGYSPYKNVAELLDPLGVRDDSTRWGLVTRFEKLSELFPETSFELFEKNKLEHFSVETGFVDLSLKDMPSGIGELKEIIRVPQEAGGKRTRGVTGSRGDYVYTEKVLVDPMTGEEISKTYDIYTQDDISQDPELTDKDLGRKKINKLTGEEEFVKRDQWFRIKAKFAWKDAPGEKKSGNKSSGRMRGMY
jgi:type IV pilus assembly protein PilM